MKLLDLDAKSDLSVMENLCLPTGGIVGSSERHTVEGLSKNQKPNLKKKQNQISSSEVAGESSAGSKRPRSDSSTPSPSGTKSAKNSKKEIQPRERIQSEKAVHLQKDNQLSEDNETEEDNQLRSYSLEVSLTKIAVVKRDFPADMLSEEDAETIEREILGLIDSIPDLEWMPRICGNSWMKWALILHCASDTVDWVRKNFEGRTIGDMTVKVLMADELLMPVKVAFQTTEIFSAQNIFLKRLQRLNPELKLNEWRVLQSTVGPVLSRWIFEVELEDIEVICRANFRAFTGIDRGIFKIIHDLNRKEPEKGGEKSAAPSDPVELTESGEDVLPESSACVAMDVEDSMSASSKDTLEGGEEEPLRPTDWSSFK